MQKKLHLILNIFLSIVLLFTMGVSLFAWYVNQDRKPSTTINSSGIVISYALNDEEIINNSTYEIENITFFDIDNENEGKYFTKMAILLELNLVNKSDCAVDLTVAQTNVSNDSAYVTCAISSDELDSYTDAEDDLSVSDFINDLSNSKTQTLESAAEVTYYIYIYGVQPDDSADNTFVGALVTYTFNLTITAKAHVEE